MRAATARILGIDKIGLISLSLPALPRFGMVIEREKKRKKRGEFHSKFKALALLKDMIYSASRYWREIFFFT
jgi:hypothetical protein